MSCEFVSMEDAGTRTGDFVMRLRWKPSQLRRWFGAREEVVAYYGQGAKWHPIYGLPVSSRVRSVLEQIWHERRPLEGLHLDAAKVTPHVEPRIAPACFVLVQEASEGSFPASDPPAWTLGR